MKDSLLKTMVRTHTPSGIAFIKLGLVVLVIIVYAFVLRHTFTSIYGGGSDFYIPWRAIQSLLWEGRDPYGSEVSAEIQHFLFGRALGPNEHQFDFAYPLTLAPLLAPYTLFPFDWAQPLWQATLHALLLIGLFLWYPRIYPEAWIGRWALIKLAALLLWTLTLYPALRAFYLGQVALLVFGAVTVGFWALVRGHDRTAGIALAIATVKPQLSFLIVPAILFILYTQRRRQTLRAFGATLAALLALSLTWMPTWPLAFLRRLAEYRRYTDLGVSTDSPSPLALLLQPLGSTAPLLESLIALAVLVAALHYVWKQRQAPNWPHLFSILLCVSAWIAPRAATTDQTLLVLPLLFLLVRRSRYSAVVIAASLWSALWFLWLVTVQGSQEDLIMRLPLPLLITALWLWDWHTTHRRARLAFRHQPAGMPGE